MRRHISRLMAKEKKRGRAKMTHFDEYHSPIVDIWPITDETLRLVHDEDHEQGEGIRVPHVHLSDGTIRGMSQ